MGLDFRSAARPTPVDRRLASRYSVPLHELVEETLPCILIDTLVPSEAITTSDGLNDRGKTVTELVGLIPFGLPSSEKQIPQVVENLESGGKPKEALERTVMRPRQVRYQAALRPDILCQSF